MRRIILAPDSFKGTMSSVEICNIMSSAIKKHLSEAEIVKIPVADGGEGTVECFLEAVGSRKIALKVKGPYFEEIDSFYGILSVKNDPFEMDNKAKCREFLAIKEELKYKLLKYNKNLNIPM